MVTGSQTDNYQRFHVFGLRVEPHQQGVKLKTDSSSSTCS